MEEKMFSYDVTVIITRKIVGVKNPPPAELQHFIKQEFLLREGDGFGNWIISAPSPEHCDSRNISFRGTGKSVSVAIMDYLKSLVSSNAYCPEYFKRK